MAAEQDRLYELDDEELATVIMTGTAGEQDAARVTTVARYHSLCALVARQNCQHLAHRARECVGALDTAADHAYPDLVAAYEQKIAGRTPSVERPGLTSLLVQWANGKRTVTFARYFSGRRNRSSDHPNARQRTLRLGPGGLEEALRVWNGARGMGVRARPRQLLRRGLGDYYQTMLAAQPDLARVARPLGLDGDEGIVLVVTALWWDACQPRPTHGADVERVVRHLKRMLHPTAFASDQEAAVGVLIERIDALVAAVDEQWYDRWISGPRSQTLGTVESQESAS